jgi:hypothetical protein
MKLRLSMSGPEQILIYQQIEAFGCKLKAYCKLDDDRRYESYSSGSYMQSCMLVIYLFLFAWWPEYLTSSQVDFGLKPVHVLD